LDYLDYMDRVYKVSLSYGKSLKYFVEAAINICGFMMGIKVVVCRVQVNMLLLRKGFRYCCYTCYDDGDNIYIGCYSVVLLFKYSRSCY
jgi:hypothetical protein